MTRRLQIHDLMTLVARALQAGEYSPAESGRVRAVPDTRTIRYYTTLGLISPPVEMRGRVAYYDEAHLLQIVAVKQLQSQDLSLSDIQQRLVGLTPGKLQAIAKLPDDFWTVADQYLAAKEARLKSPSQDAAQVAESHAGLVAQDGQFWLTTAALPSSVLPTSSLASSPDGAPAPTAETPAMIRLPAVNGVRISIELPQGTQLDNKIDAQALLSATQHLIKELRRQKLIDE